MYAYIHLDHKVTPPYAMVRAVLACELMLLSVLPYDHFMTVLIKAFLDLITAGL